MTVKTTTLPRTTTAEFVVWDEHWPDCAEILVSNLRDIPGVESVEVDLISGVLAIAFDSQYLKPTELVAMIRAEGFSLGVDAVIGG